MDRREFLVYLGVGSYALLRGQTAFAKKATQLLDKSTAKKPKRLFNPISPSTKDELILPSGFTFDVVASLGDPLEKNGPFGPEFFGSDNDFTAFFPHFDPNHGLLWVNHEFVTPALLHGIGRNDPKTKAMIQKEKLSVGGSVIEVKLEKGHWIRVPSSKYARRLTASYPTIPFTGPVSERLRGAVGTLANCSGGVTPWRTVLTCEENFQLMNPIEGGLGWSREKTEAIDEENYGWVVEVDPTGELPTRKHSSLGRFSHENAAIRVGNGGHVVVYMGDDSRDQFVYKFVSREPLRRTESREKQSALLSDGILYAADFAKGRWLPLDLKLNPSLQGAGFKSQADVLIDTRKAAQIAGATPMDRPEDCEVHPLDGSVYIAFTNNVNHGNFYGQIVRLIESGDDAEALNFRFEIYLAGGPRAGLASPDNLIFDSQGNLWVSCDIATDSLRRGAYEVFGNNGLFMVPTRGSDAGTAFQFASGPIDSELTGMSFTPDGKTLFLSVQHPGETTQDPQSPTSHWPTGSGLPKPSVVAIRGFG